jgi:hypothetical protein
MKRLRSVCAALAAVCAGASLAQAGGLPWGREWAGDARLPLPYGAGLTFYAQNQGYELDRLSLSLPGLAVGADEVGIDNRIRELNVQLDAWLLPFLNVFGIAGKIDGLTRVDLSRVEASPIPLGLLDIDYDGDVYGVGTTVVAGNQRYFASLTGIWTTERLSGDFSSDAEALVVSPRFGIHDERTSAWVGATFQDAKEAHQGRITLPVIGSVGFDVHLKERDPWNVQVGMATALSEHWHLHAEGGFAKRLSAELGATYRF